MNTQEARIGLRDLAREALAIVEEIERGHAPSPQARLDLHRLASEARALIYDAGYPGEATWRGLSRASMGADTLVDAPDPTFWNDAAEELRIGVETLEALLTSGIRHETDFPLVG
jgi:hypothetical protein